MNETAKGTMLTLIAGIAWGLSGVSGQYLMAQGIPVLWLTSVRLLISGIFLLTFAYCWVRESLFAALKNKRTLWQIFVFALFGLILNQIGYLSAIHHTNAGTATVLQYLCPIIVLVYTCLRNRQRPMLTELVAIVLSVVGTFLIATHGHVTSLAVTPLGLFWGLFSAVTYALYIILPVSLIRQYGSLTVMGIGMLMGGISMAVVGRSWTYALVLDTDIVLGLVGIVGVGTIFAYTVFLHGVSLIGSVKGSLLASIEPVSSVLLGMLLMHEMFYPMDLLGMLAILAAVLVISLRDLVIRKKSI